jgi:vacuolar-type H+-ATPase subunit E/Vma4
MSLKHDLQDAGNHVKKAGENIAHAGEKTLTKIKDTVNEAVHKAAAQAERREREEVGESMTGTQKAKSVLNEAKHNVQAGVAAAKKNVDDI